MLICHTKKKKIDCKHHQANGYPSEIFPWISSFTQAINENYRLTNHLFVTRSISFLSWWIRPQHRDSPYMHHEAMANVGSLKTLNYAVDQMRWRILKRRYLVIVMRLHAKVKHWMDLNAFCILKFVGWIFSSENLGWWRWWENVCSQHDLRSKKVRMAH